MSVLYAGAYLPGIRTYPRYSDDREQVYELIIKNVKSKLIKNEIMPVNITENIMPVTRLLRDSFIGVADEMGFTPENCPNHVAFITEERLLEQLGSDRAYCFGIRDGDKWIGFVAVAPYGESYEITRLAVSPGHRHRGYGRALMDKACDKARELGLESIGLGILNDNVPFSLLPLLIDEQRVFYAVDLVPPCLVV